MQRDDVYLLDILDSARQIVRYLDGISNQQFLRDVLRQDAVIRRLLVIGEASRRLSDECREEHPGLPWRSIIGLRNVLVHDYDDIDLEAVWRTIQLELPKLIGYLEAEMRDLLPLMPSD